MNPLTEIPTEALLAELLDRHSEAVFVGVKKADPERYIETSFVGQRVATLGLADYCHARMLHWMATDSWPSNPNEKDED